MKAEDIGKKGNMKKKQGKRKIDGVVEERVERGRVAELIKTRSGEVQKIVPVRVTRTQEEEKRGGKVGRKNKVVDVTQMEHNEKMKCPEDVKAWKVVRVRKGGMREKHRGGNVGQGTKVKVFCSSRFRNMYKGTVFY